MYCDIKFSRHNLFFHTFDLQIDIFVIAPCGHAFLQSPQRIHSKLVWLFIYFDVQFACVFTDAASDAFVAVDSEPVQYRRIEETVYGAQRTEVSARTDGRSSAKERRSQPV